MGIEEQREYLAEKIMQAKKKNIESKLKMKPIKFCLGSWFEYNNKIYVLIGDNNGDPIFEKLSECPQWIIDLDSEVQNV